MIIDFATMLETISKSNAGLLNIIQQSIDAQNGDREGTVPGTTGDSKQEQEQKTNKDKDQDKDKDKDKDKDQDPPPLFEDVAPLQYKKGEKERILIDPSGNTIATMERIDVKPVS